MPFDTTPQLDIDVQHNGEMITVRLTGEFDAATAPSVDAAVDAAAMTPGTEVTLDLSGISFLDSSGLRSLLQLRERTTRAGATICITAASSVVTRLFELTGLTDQFPIVAR